MKLLMFAAVACAAAVVAFLVWIGDEEDQRERMLERRSGDVGW